MNIPKPKIIGTTFGSNTVVGGDRLTDAVDETKLNNAGISNATDTTVDSTDQFSTLVNSPTETLNAPITPINTTSTYTTTTEPIESPPPVEPPPPPPVEPPPPPVEPPPPPVEPPPPPVEPPPPPVDPLNTTSTTFELFDPITGQTISFDDKAKFDKAEKLQTEQLLQRKKDLELRGIADDIVTASAGVIKDMIEGKDPIKQAEWNFALQKLNAYNQSQMSATMMKLKGLGIDPNAPGAGASIMTMLARQSGQQLTDVINKLNVESANRMVDFSKYGIEKATQINKYINDQRIEDFNYNAKQVEYLASVIKTDDPLQYEHLLAGMGLPIGVNTDQFIKDIKSENINDNAAAWRTLSSDYSNTRNTINTLVPNIDYNDAAFSGLNGDQKSDIFSRLNAISTSLSKGINGKAEARSLLQDLQKIYPNVITGDYSKWDPDSYDPNGAFERKKANLSILQDMISLAGISESKLSDAADWASQQLINPATVDKDYLDLWSTINEQQKSELKKLAGLTDDPLDEQEKRLILGADQVKGLQNKVSSIEGKYEAFYKTSSDAFKQWIINDKSGKNAGIFKQYLTVLSLGGNAVTVGADGQLNINSSAILDPTNPASILANKYMDWPVGVNKDGVWVGFGDPSALYMGNQPIDDDNMNEGGSGEYQRSLDKQWESYIMAGGELSRIQWFNNSKFGLDGKPTIKITPEKVDPNAPYTSSGATQQQKDDYNKFLLDYNLINPVTKESLITNTYTQDVLTGTKELSDLLSTQIDNINNNPMEVSALTKKGLVSNESDKTTPNLENLETLYKYINDNKFRVGAEYYINGYHLRIPFKPGQFINWGGKIYELYEMQNDQLHNNTNMVVKNSDGSLKTLHEYR